MEEKKRKGNPRMIKGQVAYPDAPKGGRPKGSVNKMTLLAQQMMTDRGPMIVEKVMGMALQGDVHCLKMCMDRILPVHKAIDSSKTKTLRLLLMLVRLLKYKLRFLKLLLRN